MTPAVGALLHLRERIAAFAECLAAVPDADWEGTYAHTYPVVDASGNDGATFAERARLNPKVRNNWGDRDFIVAGRHGLVYLTWDYGPSAAVVRTICPPGGSCGIAAGDLNVVIQKSIDYGRTWGPIIHVSPGFPANGADSAPLVLERDGDVAIAYQGYHIDNTATYAMKPAHMYSLKHRWLSRPIMVSRRYGHANIWPGDTFGISALPGGRIALSWGSAVGGSRNSAIWATVVKVAAGR